MSVTGSFDSYANAPTTQSAGGVAGEDAQLDEASASGEHNSGIFGVGSGIGNLTQSATQAAKQGADAVVNAGKSVVEMGGSLISGLKRGFSKTSETGGEQ